MYEQSEGEDVKLRVARISAEIKNLCQEELKPDKKEKGKKPWMTDGEAEVSQRKIRIQNNQQGIRSAKESWMGKSCHEMEEPERKHNPLNIHRKVKEI